jgi:phosphoglycerate dehydrogenase-like enzyme
VRITSAYGANAIPVAEMSLSQILFCLKRGWQYVRNVRRTHDWMWDHEHIMPGAYRSTVGVVSLGMIGRHLCRLLKAFDVNVLACDPFATAEDEKEFGVTLVGLEELFVRADVVSLHTPWLPETDKMITGDLLRSMKKNAALINTARGGIIDQPDMIRVLKERPDLTAVLDVTHPEPPVADCELFDLDNVVLTPHIAGAMHTECRRMARFMIDEIDRYLAGEPLQWEITRNMNSGRV